MTHIIIARILFTFYAPLQTERLSERCSHVSCMPFVFARGRFAAKPVATRKLRRRRQQSKKIWLSAQSCLYFSARYLRTLQESYKSYRLQQLASHQKIGGADALLGPVDAELLGQKQEFLPRKQTILQSNIVRWAISPRLRQSVCLRSIHKVCTRTRLRKETSCTKKKSDTVSRKVKWTAIKAIPMCL